MSYPRRSASPQSTTSRSPFLVRSFRERAPFFVLIAGALLAAAAFIYVRHAESLGVEREFRRRAQNVSLRVEDYLQRREETLYALRDFFDFSGEVSRDQFEGFAHDLLSRQVGIQALEWVPIVPDADRATYEAEARAAGYLDFHFTERTAPDATRPAATRPLHAPVYYLTPYQGNERALGFDVASDSAAWTRLQRYAAEGQLAASGRVPLLASRPADHQWGYITEIPVYQKPFASVAPGDRMGQLRGYLIGVFHLGQVFEEMFDRMGGLGVDVLFLDRSAEPDRQFLHFHSAASAASVTHITPPTEKELAAGLHVVIPLRHASRDWELWLRPSAAWLASQGTYRSWFFASVIFSLSALISLYLRSQQRRTELIEGTVNRRTAELLESRRELESFLQSLPGMAYRGTYDETLNLLFVSAGSTVLTGWAPHEFLTGVVHMRDLVHPDDVQRVRNATRRALETRQPMELEYRIHTRDGHEKWLLSRGSGVYYSDGRLQAFEGLAIDITAQKLAESERLGLERKLLEGQKLESLGLLAGGIAHDFNNLLTGILGNAALSRLSLPAGSPIDTQLRAIETASLRAAELCNQMLAYAGKGRFVVEAVDIGTLAEGLVPLLEISIARQAQLRLELDRKAPAVLADATQLRQIVMNLVLNAADAIGNRGGSITLTTGLQRADEAFLRSCVAGAELPAGDYVFVEVRDTGCGMSPETIAKIFDPFFTTKFAGRGLGLAAVLGIVRGHNGALHVASEVGHGSSFRLLLPPSPDAATSAKTAPAPSSWRYDGSALLIDDEEAVRMVTERLLDTFGFTTQPASDGETGLAIFRERATDFDLVVLDLLMPGMSGEDTLDAIRSVRPDVRVLLISGYSEGDTVRRLRTTTAPLAFLHKPFTRDALEQKLRELFTS